MKKYSIKVDNKKIKLKKEHINMGGHNKDGDVFTVNNYYLEYNKKAFFGVSGEFHYSRYDEKKWEDEIIKMKMCGINIIATYIFWIHHEEIKGEFVWTGSKNLRKFLELCSKHNMYVIIRIGPFAHGECRNGGMPDWLYGRPFEVRSNNEEYLFFVDRLYGEIAKQVDGLLFEESGPIIGIQIENEYMHSSAPQEFTTGINNEWITTGKDGEEHIRKLKKLAISKKLITPFYTATAWGGAICPTNETLPVWGGYAFHPWIFYDDIKEHPATEEYIFRDYHNNKITSTYNFEPRYKPEDYPYICCEMGGGMTVFYKYRFVLPPQSVEAMAIIKAASGCNFLGYYMFHGGSNPLGEKTQYLNEHQTPKISYDYQAAIGEFGQIREHYKRLKILHYFFGDFQELFCSTKTYLPKDIANIKPNNVEDLRYALRAYDDSGFLFITNYQDHVKTNEKKDFSITINLENENITIPEKAGDLYIEKDESLILPFNLNMSGIKLKYSTSQLITKIKHDDEYYYFFTSSLNSKSEFVFDEKYEITSEEFVCKKYENKVKVLIEKNKTGVFTILSKDAKVNVVNLSRKDSFKLWKGSINGIEHILLSDAQVLIKKDRIKLIKEKNNEFMFSIFPDIKLKNEDIKSNKKGIFKEYEYYGDNHISKPIVNKVDSKRAILTFKEKDFEGLNELLLKISYEGDIGNAFIDGELINDNFNNGSVWEIGLMKNKDKLLSKGMYIYISPFKEDSKVKSDSVMASREEIVNSEVADIKKIEFVKVYDKEIKV